MTKRERRTGRETCPFSHLQQELNFRDKPISVEKTTVFQYHQYFKSPSHQEGWRTSLQTELNEVTSMWSAVYSRGCLHAHDEGSKLSTQSTLITHFILRLPPFVQLHSQAKKIKNTLAGHDYQDFHVSVLKSK